MTLVAGGNGMEVRKGEGNKKGETTLALKEFMS